MKRESNTGGVRDGFVRLSFIIGVCATTAMLVAMPPPQTFREQRIAIQVGAFQRFEGAAVLAAELAQKGYPARTIPSTSLHRVMVGPFPNQSAAETVLSELKRSGYDGYVRKDVVFDVEPSNDGSEIDQERTAAAAVDSARLPVNQPAPAESPVLKTPWDSPIEEMPPADRLRTTTDSAQQVAAAPLQATESVRGGRPQQDDLERSPTGAVQPGSHKENDQVSDSPLTVVETNIADQNPQPQHSELRMGDGGHPPGVNRPDVGEAAALPASDLGSGMQSTAAPVLTEVSSPQSAPEVAANTETATEITQAGNSLEEAASRATAVPHSLHGGGMQPAPSGVVAVDTEPAEGAFLARVAQTTTPQESAAAQGEPANARSDSTASGQNETPAAQTPSGGNPALAIKILEGSEVVHTVGQRTARDPVVQVVDENDRPVAGAVVLFDLPSRGASGTFANGARSVTVLTGPDGTATATGFTANSAQGQYAMQVTASHQGQTATTAVAQANAAAAGGGLSAAATAGIVGAIAGGAAVALVVVKNSIENRVRQEIAARNPPSTITTVSPGPSNVGAP